MARNIKLFEQFNGIEDKARLSDSMVKLLNEQIKNELESSQIYRAISCWCDDKGLIKPCKHYKKYAQEELLHMEKIYDYLFDKNCKAKTPAVNEVKETYKDIYEVLEQSLEHEIQVTKNWNDIADQALKEKDNDTYALSQWFLKEQIEEEQKIRDMIFDARLENTPLWKIMDLFE